ncbi:dynamin family protein [Aliarcobacter cryaerophilus]|uniref:dynamin family protein n=1 Tax=Aliarcobacter cryaerophilus TaxID=28198 RepID=UPI0021B5F08A|nr:dynamin family protein [Aliarcobacter cryaerophilus]MCT7493960.1 dynamin family protein [Aliarcobacter cryaerophilus]
MNQFVKLEDFYKSLKDIKLINNSVDEKRELVKKYVSNFNANIQNLRIDENIKKQNKEISSLLEETINLIKLVSNDWLKNFDEMIEREKFRSDLSNYFIVIIFGKVKAGKSSLGNFIAKNKLDSQKVEFFKYDEAGKKQTIKKLEEIDEDSFATNNLECTVEIQGFKLDGMAWIDTPGLGSMVKENGDLAKEYIQSADYIIYPTSSDSPLQLDEREQLKELFEQNKKVSICITKSDYNDEDECDCGSEDGCKNCNKGIIKVLKNKSLLNRQKQEVFVKEEIYKLIPKDKNYILGDIFSISTHAAKNALCSSDNEFFEDSNIPKFYELLTDVIRDKASKLKADTPYEGLKSFIDFNILGSDIIKQNSSIKNIKLELESLEQVIRESQERFEILKENSSNDLVSEIEFIISKYSLEINKSNSKEMFLQIDSEINKKMFEIIEKNISEILNNFDASFKSLRTTFSSNEFIIEDVYESIKVDTSSRNKKIGAGVFGTLGSILSGIFLASNPIGWAVAGTIVAGAAAGYAGGKLGEFSGSIDEEKIVVGDNKEQILLKFKNSRLENYEKIAKGMYNEMQSLFFVPLEKSLNEIKSNLNQFEQNIKQIF